MGMIPEKKKTRKECKNHPQVTHKAQRDVTSLGRN